MKKSKLKQHLLTQAVLTSTLFISSLAHATDFNGTTAPDAGPIATGAQLDNNITVVGGSANPGQIIGTDLNAVNLDSKDGQVVVQSVNALAGPDAIQATGAGAQAIGINITGINGIVTVGAGSGVHSDATTAGSDAIFVGATGASITNAGSIISDDFSAINIDAAGTMATVTNQLAGVISNSVDGTTPTILVGGTGLTLNNSGIIGQLAADQATIQLNADFTAINNNAGGIIGNAGAAATAHAIDAVAAFSGTITNGQNGQIIVDGAGHNINTTVASTGSIINSGIMDNTGTGNVINLGASIGGVTNNATGVLHGTAPAGATVFAAAGTVITNNLVNSGNIINDADAGNAIDLSSAGTQGAVMQMGGTIIGDVLLAGADALGGSDVFNMSGGVISGNVVGAAVQANHFTLTGGTLGGILAGNGIADSNIFDISGTARVDNDVLMGGTGSVLNLSDNAWLFRVQGGTANNVYNVEGGTLLELQGAGGTDILNVNGNFTGGIINDVPVINVNNPGTVFTANGPITNMNTVFLIDENTTLIPNNLIQGTGDVINNGTIHVMGMPTIDLLPGGGIVDNNNLIWLGNESVLTINGNTEGVLTNNPDAIINQQIRGIYRPCVDDMTAGQIQVNSNVADAVDLQEGSFIQPQFFNFLPAGTTFDLVTVNPAAGGGTINDESLLLQPASAVVFFSKELNADNDILTLTAHRHTYTSLTSTQVTQGVAGALDVLALGNGPCDSQLLLTLLSQLDQLPDAASVEAALQSLAPPFNWGLVQGSHVGMDIVFDSVRTHIEDLYARRHHRRDLAQNDQAIRVAQNGISFGDPAGAVGVWGQIYGAHDDQSTRDNVAGYKVNAGGAALGIDWGVNDCTTLGLALSYTKVSVDDDNWAPKDVGIKAWQGTLYGQFEFKHGLYLDAQGAVAHNDYHLNRQIKIGNGFIANGENFINTAAQADFDGTQWGLQGDLGWSVCNDEQYFFAPFLRLKYIHLDLDGYTEYGASDLGLSVASQNIDEFMGGIGFRLGTTIEQGRCMWVPELTAMIGYDFNVDNEASSASFIGGSPVFVTDGIKPGRTIFDLGLGLGLHVQGKSVMEFKYNLELRDDYVGNAGFIQYKYLWC